MHLGSNNSPSDYKETVIDTRSRILDPQTEDYIQLAKRNIHERFFDNMIEPSMCSSGIRDFIVVLTDGFIQVYSVSGLRNFPTKSFEVQLQTNVQLAFHINSDSRFF